MKDIQKTIRAFDAADVKAYNKLGKDVFQKAKVVLLDQSYDEDLFNELHVYFNGIEGDMHRMIGTKNISDAKNEQQKLLKKINAFFDYFEE